MSEAIYSRAMVREQSIWPSFFYNIPGAETIKIVVFGLYANTYLLGHNYLEDIETEELQRLVDVYDSNIAELTMEEQSLVLEIASKRYVKTIELQIKNDVLTTKRQQLEADEQEYEAKLVALEVDREALETKRTQIELARDRAELKNRDLEVRIRLEQLAQDYVAVEISQKQLEASRAELSVLLAGLRGLEIQIDISNTSLRIIEIEVSKSQIEADIAGIKARIAGQDLTTKQLEVDEAELEAMQYEIDNIAVKKIELIESQGEILTNEMIHTEVLEGKEAEIKIAQTGEQNAEKESTLDGFDDRKSMAKIEEEQSEYDDNLNIEVARDRKDSQVDIASTRTILPLERRSAARTAYAAAVEAAEILALADITNTLTHEIGAA